MHPERRFLAAGSPDQCTWNGPNSLLELGCCSESGSLEIIIPMCLSERAGFVVGAHSRPGGWKMEFLAPFFAFRRIDSRAVMGTVPTANYGSTMTWDGWLRSSFYCCF